MRGTSVLITLGLLLAACATIPARRVQRTINDDQDAADRAGRDTVHTLCHAHTNYDDLVTEVAAICGRSRPEVVAILRHRVFRALACRFPGLADQCRALAEERPAPSYRQVRGPDKPPRRPPHASTAAS